MTTPTPTNRFMAPGPWITRELRWCVQASDYDALQRELAAAKAENARLRKTFLYKECGIHLDDAPGVRGECAEKKRAGKPCPQCPDDYRTNSQKGEA